ncbi:putative Histidine kinase [Candidatus Terasakiella magnetica]|uniref:Putative Histidine kinase n=1 Tax=Candidatus Terasakiella magnetica TaxID=1867952 RepID=A0A1C3RE90_9PROT|nr:response regulator [Candidatus Terasakiella magnetica]SCA55548.1 putative Histidine kinase [Candidatus Terasakiella magnetica]
MTLILVVEDENDVREDIIDLLELNGYDTIEAIDGEDGIAKILQYRPDLIISDIGMPNVDGHEFFTNLKNDHPEIAGIPFIFLTAFSSRENEIRGKEMGVNDFLTKPIDYEILLASIHAQLESTKRSLQSYSITINDFFNKLESGCTQENDKVKQAQLACVIKRYKDLLARMNRPIETLQKISRVDYKIKTIADAENVALTMSHLFPVSDSALLGLNELLINAIEHGNLGVCYEGKGKLLTEGRWEEEINRRLAMDEYKDKYVSCRFEHFDDRIEVTIEDQGKGFDWQKFVDSCPTRMLDLHGRGIMLTFSMGFDEVEYQGCGNKVVARTYLKKA